MRLSLTQPEVWNQLGTLAKFPDLGDGNGGDRKSREAKGNGVGKDAFFSEVQMTECDFMKYDLVGKALQEHMISEYATLFSGEGFGIVLGTAVQGAPCFTTARKKQYVGSKGVNSATSAMTDLGFLFR